MLERSNTQNPHLGEQEILSSKEPEKRDRVAEDPLRLDTASLEDLRKAMNAINKKIKSKVKEEQKIKEEQKAKEEERKETKKSSPTHPSFGAQSSAIANYPTGRPNSNHQGARNKGQRFKPNNSPNASKYRGHTNRSHSKGKQRNKNGSQQNEFKTLNHKGSSQWNENQHNRGKYHNDRREWNFRSTIPPQSYQSISREYVPIYLDRSTFPNWNTNPSHQPHQTPVYQPISNRCAALQCFGHH